MKEFYRLLTESVIVQALLTLVLTCTVCYLYLTGREVPDVLLSAFFVVLGYYFRHKSEREKANARTNFDQ